MIGLWLIPNHIKWLHCNLLPSPASDVEVHFGLLVLAHDQLGIGILSGDGDACGSGGGVGWILSWVVCGVLVGAGWCLGPWCGGSRLVVVCVVVGVVVVWRGGERVEAVDGDQFVEAVVGVGVEAEGVDARATYGSFGAVHVRGSTHVVVVVVASVYQVGDFVLFLGVCFEKTLLFYYFSKIPSCSITIFKSNCNYNTFLKVIAITITILF